MLIQTQAKKLSVSVLLFLMKVSHAIQICICAKKFRFPLIYFFYCHIGRISFDVPKYSSEVLIRVRCPITCYCTSKGIYQLLAYPLSYPCYFINKMIYEKLFCKGVTEPFYLIPSSTGKIGNRYRSIAVFDRQSG